MQGITIASACGAVLMLLHLCAAAAAAPTHAQEPEAPDSSFDSESFNTKWTAIKTWMNSTKLVASTGTVESPRIKLLCTNKFIDLIVVMCKQYSSHQAHYDSISSVHAEASPTPRLRHLHHWNTTNSAGATKKLRSLLRRVLPATVIHTCCSQSCNVTKLLNYCPVEHHPKPMAIGTITVMHAHNRRFFTPYPGNSSTPANEAYNRMRHNYEVWRAMSDKRRANATASANSDGTPVPTTSTFNYESSQSDEYNANESGGGGSVGLGRIIREHYHQHHQSTEPPATTTSTTPQPTPRHPSFIDTYSNTPEPYTFGLRSTDILYRP